MLAVHADWSTDARKRWMSWAVPARTGWRVAAPRPVDEVSTLFARLRAAAAGGAVALGVDLPLGLPRAYAALYAKAGSFPDFLRNLSRGDRLFRVCASLDEIEAGRPFYPATSLPGVTRASHAAALGLSGPGALSRLCDRATNDRPAGAPLFWTLGANQTGKAAIAAWRDLLIPALACPDPPLLWPFDGAFRALLAPGRVVIAETYPAEASRQIGLRMTGSKRRPSDRQAAGGGLHRALQRLGCTAEPELQQAIAIGFAPCHGGDDGFDSLLGLLCVLGVLAGLRPDGIPDDPWLRRWEGWVLGQTALPAGAVDAAAAPPL